MLGSQLPCRFVRGVVCSDALVAQCLQCTRRPGQLEVGQAAILTGELEQGLHADGGRIGMLGCDLVRCGNVDAQSTPALDRKSTRLNSSHLVISYAVFCLKKKT